MLFAICLFWAQAAVSNEAGATPTLELKLVQELTLGEDENDENQLFTMGARVAADENGTMYILDPGNGRVVVFDKDGGFVRTFGKKGQGPGEFQQPNEIVIHDGQVMVVDTGARKLHMFDAEGAFQGEKALPPGFRRMISPAFFKNGHIAFTSIQTDAQNQTFYDFSMYDADLKPLKSYIRVEQPKIDWRNAQDPNFWVSFLKNQFESIGAGFPIHTGVGDDAVVLARTDRYRGDIIGQDGNVKIAFDKAFKPKPFTDEAKHATFERIWSLMSNNPMLGRNMTRQVFDRALAEAELPDRLMPLWSLFSLGGDRFATLANFDAHTSTGSLDVFDSRGKWLGSADYQGAAQYLVGQGDRIYAVGPNEEDNLIVIRYRLDGLR